MNDQYHRIDASIALYGQPQTLNLHVEVVFGTIPLDYLACMAIHVLALKNGLLVFKVYMVVLLKMLSKISANIWLIQKITKFYLFLI